MHAIYIIYIYRGFKVGVIFLKLFYSVSLNYFIMSFDKLYNLKFPSHPTMDNRDRQ